MKTEERTHLTEKLTEIQPIDLDAADQHLKDIWPWKKGLVSDKTVWSVVGWVAIGAVVFSTYCLLGWHKPLQMGVLATLATLGIWLALYAISDNGLVRFFCPARRKLAYVGPGFTWSSVRCWMSEFNSKLRQLQAKADLLEVGMTREQADWLYSTMLVQRNNLMLNFDVTARALGTAKIKWEQNQARRLVSAILGDKESKSCFGEEEKK